MVDSRADLPPDLLAKIDAYVLKHSDRRDVMERFVQKHAQAESQKERDTIEKMLLSVVSPSRFGLYLGLGLPVALGAVFFGLQWLEADHAAAVAAGQRATAYVQRMEDGDCWVSSKTSTCVRVILRVYLSGRPTYEAELTESVANRNLPRVQPGNWITVSVDKTDPKLVLLDRDALAVPPPPPVEE